MFLARGLGVSLNLACQFAFYSKFDFVFSSSDFNLESVPSFSRVISFNSVSFICFVQNPAVAMPVWTRARFHFLEITWLLPGAPGVGSHAFSKFKFSFQNEFDCHSMASR